MTDNNNNPSFNSYNNDGEESSPLLKKNLEDNDKKPAKVSADAKTATAEYGCTVNGLPLIHGSVMGEPMGRTQWDSCLFCCLGRNDEFCSSDLEVCLLGSIAPCVLYGSNAERLGSTPGTFASHCLSYYGLYLIGSSFLGGNCLAPWFSYPSRTAIRRKFNLEGSCEALNRSCGCCGSFVEDGLPSSFFVFPRKNQEQKEKRGSIHIHSKKRRRDPHVSIHMTSDFALQIPAELETALQLKTVQYLVTKRPWLDLYGVNVRPVAPYGSASRRVNVDPALIHRCLPDELLFEVFSRMAPYDLGRAACVCRKWRYTLRNPIFWRNACLKAWQLSGMVENYKILQSKYESSWRKMWLLRPRIRIDGLYVSRNTYIRAGVREWTVTNPVHLVCYYRYMRIFPSGRFLYKTSGQTVKEVVKCMSFRASKTDGVFSGRYTLTDDKVEATFMYPGLCPTMWRACLRLRGTTLGANNRMDLLSLSTSKVNSDGIIEPGEDILGPVELQESVISRISHQRGLAPFAFVPFEEVETSVLNLPVEKMDYYLPG